MASTSRILKLRTRRVLVAASWFVAAIGFAHQQSHAALNPTDALLQKAIEKSLTVRGDEALPTARAVRDIEPRSRLAHWLEAQNVLATSGLATQVKKSDLDLVRESEARLHRVPEGHLPANIIALADNLNIGRYLLLSDLSISRIYIFDLAQKKPTLIREIYSSIGLAGAIKQREGDRKTPIGVYRLMKEIRNPRPDGFLGDLAITLDYPNAEDRRAQRTGSGIWIHGVPQEVHVRPPRSSDGCLAVANSDMEMIRNYVEFGKTHIVIAPDIQWLSPADWEAHQAKRLALMGMNRQSVQLTNQAVFFVSESRPIVAIQRDPQGLRRLYWAQQQRQASGPMLVEDL
jgi:hypothetical protein